VCDGAKWEVVAKLPWPRFSHQLVPAAKADALLVVGGASREGHLADVELVDVSQHAVEKAAANKDNSVPVSDPSSYHHSHSHDSQHAPENADAS